MKKIFVAIIVLLVVNVVNNVIGQETPERFNISYGMYNTVNDQRILSSGDSIIKVGSGVKHSVSAEVFIGNRIYRPGFYGSYTNSSFMTEQYKATAVNSFAFGYVNQIATGPFELNVYIGYFQKNIQTSGYDSEGNKFSDSVNMKGLDLGAKIIIAQQDANVFPKIELFGNGKFQFSRKMSGGIVPKGYSFGANIDIYRISMFDYYVSPFIGVNKIEEMDNYRNIYYKLGISLNNNIVRSDIAKIGAFLSWNNKIYNYSYSNVKNAVCGIFLEFNPIGLFNIN